MTTPDLPADWRWRPGRAGPEYWQAERLADSMITSCGYQPDCLAEEARMIDAAGPVRPRSHMPLMPAIPAQLPSSSCRRGCRVSPS